MPIITVYTLKGGFLWKRVQSAFYYFQQQQSPACTLTIDLLQLLLQTKICFQPKMDPIIPGNKEIFSIQKPEPEVLFISTWYQFIQFFRRVDKYHTTSSEKSYRIHHWPVRLRSFWQTRCKLHQLYVCTVNYCVYQRYY